MRIARQLVVWLSLWLACFWLWFLLVGEWNRIEIVAAAVAASAAATLGERAFARAGVRAHVPGEWLARSWRVPLMILADFGVVVWALVASAVRREIVRGAFRAHEFPAEGDDEHSAGLRAWVSVAATFSPNAYVVDIDEKRQLALLHDLVPWRQSEKPA